MDSQLKAIILNCTLQSDMITLIESANVLNITMKLYGVTSTRAQAKGEETGSGRQNFGPV